MPATVLPRRDEMRGRITSLQIVLFLASLQTRRGNGALRDLLANSARMALSGSRPERCGHLGDVLLHDICLLLRSFVNAPQVTMTVIQ